MIRLHYELDRADVIARTGWTIDQYDTSDDIELDRLLNTWQAQQEASKFHNKSGAK